MPDYAARRRTMVDTQVRPSDVTKFPIIDAMLRVEREKFVPEAQREAAYLGDNLDLGDGRIALEPRTFAKILDALDIQPDELVLDLGCGFGYSTAVLARLAEAVVAVEENETMAEDAQALLSSHGADNAAVVSAPLTEGDAKHGPYDVIVIEGGIEALPEKIADQLKEAGRIAAIFVEGALGTVKIGQKRGEVIHWHFAFNADAPVIDGFAAAPEFVF